MGLDGALNGDLFSGVCKRGVFIAMVTLLLTNLRLMVFIPSGSVCSVIISSLVRSSIFLFLTIP